jgi:imidazolonepropionase-like amidohydrolase
VNERGIRTSWRLRGAEWLDVASGERRRRDILVADGLLVDDVGDEATDIDVSGLTGLFGLWDCHTHPGGMMYDPDAAGYFEAVPDRTIRAGENLQQAARMGVTGIRAVDEANEIDLAWGTAYAAGTPAGPRVLGAGRGIRTTAGHGTAFPRTFTQLDAELVVDGADGMARAVRELVERGAQWVKIMLTGGLYSPHETVDGMQLTPDELASLMFVAAQRGIPVAAHCGGSDAAVDFARLGGRSIEHGYALDERAAAAMAAAGTWLVPTMSVTHDREFIAAEGWPDHAAQRARASESGHADALRACLEAGVRIAVGADLNPIGPRLHRELEMMERAGMSRRAVLEAATVGGRALNGLGEVSTPEPGTAADLVFVEGDPMAELSVLRGPKVVLAHGRVLVG